MPDKKEIATKEAGNGSLWDPLDGMRTFQRAMTHLFDDFFHGGSWRDWGSTLDMSPTRWDPIVDIEETDKEYVFKADVPGLTKENVTVEVDEGMLTIRGERKENKEEKAKGYVRKEHVYGSFSRSFALPHDAKPDNVRADYKNGVLTIRVGRSEALKPKTVKIDVQ